MIEPGDQLPDLTLTPLDPVTRVPVDGGAVSLAITLPDQTVVNPTVLRTGVGLYSATYVAVQSGIHVLVWTITGAYAGTYRDTRYVEQSTSIVSLEEVKSFLGIGNRQGHDETLRLIALMASDACESSEGTNRVWRRRTISAERHTAAPVIQLFRAPVESVVTVKADGVTMLDTDYDIDLRTGLVYPTATGLSYSQHRFTTSWTYVAGGALVPPIVRDGVLEMCRHLYAAQRGGSGLPSQVEPDYTTSLAYLVPNRVKMAWRAYRMPG